MDEVDEKSVPTSHSSQWYLCGSCENLHLRLYDQEGRLFATAVFSPDQVASMLFVACGGASMAEGAPVGNGGLN